MPVGADDDLLARVVQGVEGVEEFLLGLLLAGDELDVVDEQDVSAAVFGLEGLHALIAHAGDELVGEFLGGDILHPFVGVLFQHRVTDGVHQMGLAQAGAAVDEQGIVGTAGAGGYGHGRRVGELVGFAHHEGVEGVAGVEGGVRGGGSGIASYTFPRQVHHHRLQPLA